MFVFRLTRGQHSYRFDILFSDVIEPVAVLYGTFLPVFVYSSLHWLVINPYLNKLKVSKIRDFISNFCHVAHTGEPLIQLLFTFLQSLVERYFN